MTDFVFPIPPGPFVYSPLLDFLSSPLASTCRGRFYVRVDVGVSDAPGGRKRNEQREPASVVPEQTLSEFCLPQTTLRTQTRPWAKIFRETLPCEVFALTGCGLSYATKKRANIRKTFSFQERGASLEVERKGNEKIERRERREFIKKRNSQQLFEISVCSI